MIKNNNYLDSLSKSLLAEVRGVMEGKKKACKCDNNCSCGKMDNEKSEKKADNEKAEMKEESKKGKSGKQVPNCVPEEVELGEGEEKGGGYNGTAVNNAIRSSRQKISGREAKKIHALLKGSSGYAAKKNAEETKKTFPNVKHITKDGHPDWKKHGMGEEVEIEEGEEKGGGYNAPKSRGTELTYKKVLGQHTVHKGNTFHRSFPSEIEAMNYVKKNQSNEPKKKTYSYNEEAELDEAYYSQGRNPYTIKRVDGKDVTVSKPKPLKGNAAIRAAMAASDERMKAKKDAEKIDEAKAESPIKGTRLISKHQGKDGHHAEVRFNPDYNEYQVHHYNNGKHMGEGPVSYHGEGKEGREDATNTAEYEVKNYRPKNGSLQKEALEPWMKEKDAVDGTVPAYMRKKKHEDEMKKATGGPAVRTAKNEEVELDEISHKTRSSWLSKTFNNHFNHRVDDNTTASGWRIDPPLKGPMSDSRLKIYKIASDKAEKQNSKDYQNHVRKKREEHTPKVHDLRHMDHDEVYDHTQTSDKIKDGDVMRVKNGTAALIGAWPTMIHGKSDVLHSFKPGTSIKTIDDGTYHKTSDLADRTHGIKEEVEVVDNEFNRTNYKHLIGKKYSDEKAPSYARVKKVDKPLVGGQHNLDKNKNGRLDAQDFKMIRKEETIEEKLNPSMGTAKYIEDFVKSKDPRFEGKTKKERIKMALGAYYGAKNESVETEEVDTIEEAYGKKRDHKPLHIIVGGRYIATTTWAKNAEEAKARFLKSHPEHKDKRITVETER
jgi:hypothetical protein